MKHSKWIIAMAMLLSMGAQARYIAENAPFWCYGSRLNATEYTICTHASLSRLDRQLARVYGAAKANRDDYEQRNWLKYHRNACGSDVGCLRSAYLDRIEILSDRLDGWRAPRPSWCRSSRLNRTERTICRSPQLQHLDARLERVYAAARSRGRAYGQKAWLRQRNRCGSDRSCIAWQYRDRIEELEDRLGY